MKETNTTNNKSSQRNNNRKRNWITALVTSMIVTQAVLFVMWSESVLLPFANSSVTSTSSSTTTTAVRQQRQKQQQQKLQGKKEQLSCRYDGHCPVGTTCAVATTTPTKSIRRDTDDDGSNYGHLGVCERYHTSAHVGQQQQQQQQERQQRTSSFYKDFGNSNKNTVNDSDTAVAGCVQACQKELEFDEHFYQERRPVIVETAGIMSHGRPAGCVLVYQREKEQQRDQQQWSDLQRSSDAAAAKEKRGQVPPSIRYWTESSRFRHIIRVDPYQPNNSTDSRWMAYCYAPCQTDSDCVTSNDRIEGNDSSSGGGGGGGGFVCHRGSCQRNPDYWNRAKNHRTDSSTDGLIGSNDAPDRRPPAAAAAAAAPEMVLVTAACRQYLAGLRNLAASARYWAPRHKMVVYNLGRIPPETIQEIRQWPNVLAVEWSTGFPDHYPAHIQFGKMYAWKPLIINETLHKYKSVFWLDAGSTLAGPIDPVEDIVQRTGAFLVKGQDLDMTAMSHQGTYEWFQSTKGSLVTGPHFAGNTQAWLYPSRYAKSIVEANAACAVDMNCIAPTGSTLRNHRYDQTSLSVLAYQPKLQLPHYTEYLAAERIQLASDMSRPSSKFIWTSRQGCRYYTIQEQRHNATSCSDKWSPLGLETKMCQTL